MDAPQTHGCESTVDRSPAHVPTPMSRETIAPATCSSLAQRNFRLIDPLPSSLTAWGQAASPPASQPARPWRLLVSEQRTALSTTASPAADCQAKTTSHKVRGRSSRSERRGPATDQRDAKPASEVATAQPTDSSTQEASAKDVRAALLDGYRAKMKQWCRNACRGSLGIRFDTSDVLQESLVQVWQDWDRMKDKSNSEIQRWMYQIAKGHLNKLRRHHMAGRRNIYRQDSEVVEVPTDEKLGPDRSMERAERQVQIMIALERLPSDLAEVVKLRLFADLTFPDIATRLNVSPEAARNTFLRALRRLRTEVAIREVSE